MMLAELMLIFILANFGKDVIAESNCTPTLCKLRFELASEVHALRNYGGCNDVYLMDCICNRTIDVQFIEHPPYIYADAKTGKVVGLLVGVLEEALSVCCYRCTKIRYLKPYVTTTEAIIMFMSSSVLMPFVTASSAKLAVGDIFISAIPSKGVVYITSEEISMIHFSRFATSISSNWPLFCISLLLAVDAGIIVWLLDCAINHDEFPSDFRRGLLEGLWWAYVSMTTVGYGDKTPKSLMARIFGIIWITVGISLSGIFTASLITGMTQSLNDGPLNLEGKQVGVLNATRYELTIGMREGADVKGYSTYGELVGELKKGNLDGILMDLLVMKYYWNELKNDIPNFHFRLNAIENSKTSFGFLFSASETNATNRELGKFLEKFFDENRDNIDVIVKRSHNYLTKKLARIVADDKTGAESIFNSPEIYKLLFKYIGIATVFLVVLGFAFEKVRDWWKHNMRKRKERRNKRVDSSYNDFKIKVDNRSTVDYTTTVLRKRFQRVMTELETNGNKDAKDIKDKVLSRVFYYKEMKESHDNEIQLDEVNSKSDVQSFKSMKNL